MESKHFEISSYGSIINILKPIIYNTMKAGLFSVISNKQIDPVK